jgi:hypothetical protein
VRRLVVFGDSWGMGYLKMPISNQRFNPEDRRDVYWHFPRLLAKDLGLELLNYSQTGHSMTCIVNDFISYATEEYREGDFVLMVWTEWDRTTVRTKPHHGFPTITDARMDDIHPRGFKNRYVGMPQGFRLMNSTVIEYANVSGWDNPDREWCVDTTNTLEDPLYHRLLGKMSYRTFKDICREKNIPYLQTFSCCEGHKSDEVRWYVSGDGSELTSQMTRCPQKPIEVTKDYRIIDKDDPTIIESGKFCNTLLDIVIDNWLGDKYKETYFKEKRGMIRYWSNIEKRWKKNLNSHCMHPTQKGHELIAKTLAPYIKKKLEE